MTAQNSANRIPRANHVPIGFLYSSQIDPEGTPIQPCYARGHHASIKISEEFAPGLQDLDGFSHIIIIFGLHRVTSRACVVRPFLDGGRERGVFATRAPGRPNAIGFSVVRLLAVEGRELHIDGSDILNGSPIFDIKPFVPDFDVPPETVRVGWYAEAKDGATTVDDGRFVAPGQQGR